MTPAEALGAAHSVYRYIRRTAIANAAGAHWRTLAYDNSECEDLPSVFNVAAGAGHMFLRLESSGRLPMVLP